MDETALQQKYMEFQVIEQQIKSVTEQVQELNNKLMELEYLKSSLDELSKVEKKTEILAPISSGIFVRADIKDTKNLLVNVGSGTVVKKDVPATQKLMDNQVEEVEKLRTQLISQLTKLSMKSEQLEIELKDLVGAQDV